MQKLKNYFASLEFDISEPLYVVDVYKVLQRSPGVVDVLDVKIIHKNGGSYSDTTYNFNDHLSTDGRYLNAEIDTVFEMKFPAADIEGSIT